MSTLLPTCPTDCNGILPEVNFNDCAPVFAFGRLTRLYVGKPNAPAFDDESDPTEWASRLSLDGGADTNLRPLTIVGAKPVPTYTTLEYSDQRKVVTTKEHKITFYIDEVTAENHEFMRILECGGQLKFWYASAEYLWGGSEGIVGSFALDEDIPEDYKAAMKFTGSVTWFSKFHPNRIENPLT